MDLESIKQTNLPRIKILIFQSFLTLAGYVYRILYEIEVFLIANTIGKLK